MSCKNRSRPVNMVVAFNKGNQLSSYYLQECLGAAADSKPFVILRRQVIHSLVVNAFDGLRVLQ